ncbi:MAG: TIGR04348 family glycosyltransferase [Betaproteobacteria bacterium]|nr:TIGR04348 family glycosyltransferase [Betaproteobacteria bacterium]
MKFKQAKPVVVIVTPAWADANNGNWQTARRWARHLSAKHTVLLADRWPHSRLDLGPGAGLQPQARVNDLALQAQAMLALHARRSAASINAWHRQRGALGLAVVLTGTDLYKDLHSADGTTVAEVQQSMRAAQHLVVLQDQALRDLPAALAHKATLIFQSTTTRRAVDKPDLRHHPLRALMVGHLRDEKDPLTLMQAACLLHQVMPLQKPACAPSIRIDHLGAALEPQWAAAALATQAQCPLYRWLGACTHETARRRIQRAHVLVHTSRIEGGAHVIMEAVCSATPVLASRVAGNVGMLGSDYAGYFEVGDAQGLARALQRFQTDEEFRFTLQAQARLRAACFEPAREAQGLHALVNALLATSPASVRGLR